MSKIFTTIEQSKKLIELGIDRKTSDMFYWYGEDIIRVGGYEVQSEYFKDRGIQRNSNLGRTKMYLKRGRKPT